MEANQEQLAGIAALKEDIKWQGTLVTYSMKNVGGIPMTEGQQAAVRKIFDDISKFTLLQFREVTSSDAHILLNNDFLPEWVAGVTYITWDYRGNILLSEVSIDQLYMQGPAGAGHFGYSVLLHEIGHALGLDHPEGYGPHSGYTVDTTVMSYNEGDILYAEENYTYQIYDIAALQAIYGANHNTNAGQNQYRFSGYVSGDESRRGVTLWDGGGTDIINTLDYKHRVNVDLREGRDHVSNIGDEYVWIAFGANIENAATGDGDDVITGNALSNILSGGGGDDVIKGEDGADTLRGGAGDDHLEGGAGEDICYGDAGKDRLDGGAGIDVVSYFNSVSGVTIDLFTGKGTGGDAEGDSYKAIERVGGSQHDDRLAGDNEANIFWGRDGNDRVQGKGGNDEISGGNGNDILSGGADNDFLSGGEGDDTLYSGTGNDRLAGGNGDDILYGDGGVDILDGGTGIDIASYFASVAGVTVDLSTGKGTGGDAGGDSYKAIERVGGSQFDDKLTGDDKDNLFWGRGGNDFLEGKEGKDELYGGIGNDTLSGGEGNDILFGDAGSDILDGGAGTDVISYIISVAGVTVDLLAEEGEGGDAEGDSYNNIERVGGSHRADRLSGDDKANVLWGREGDDTLEGKGGNDTLWGGIGDDILDGGAGDDMISGGSGNDLLEGKSGQDSFVFSGLEDSGLGHLDTIVDFVHGEDHIILTGMGLHFSELAFFIEADGSTSIMADNGFAVTVLEVQPMQWTENDFF